MKISISVKIIRLVVVITSALGILLGWYVIGNEEKIIYEEFNERAQVLINSLVVSLEYPLLFDDEKAIYKIGSSALKQKAVAFCAIKDEDGYVVYKEGAIPEEDAKAYVAEVVNERVTDSSGEDFLFDVGKKEEKIGTVSVVFSLSEIKSKLNRLTLAIVIVLGGGIIVLFVALVFLIRSMLGKPINELIKGTNIIASGNLEYVCPLNIDNEIGQLANAFNRMTKDLKQTTVNRDYVDNILTSMNESLIVLTMDQKIKTVNEATCSLLGYKEEELIGEEISRILPPGQSISECEMKDMVKGKNFVSCEKTYCAKGGRHIPVLFSSAILHDKSKKFQGLLCVAQDITELKNAQTELSVAYDTLKTTQAQLVQSEKMAGIGQLAAGVAHEINNPIGFIMSNLESLDGYMKNLQSVIDVFEAAMDECVKTFNNEKTEMLHKRIQEVKNKANLTYIRQDIFDIISELKEGAERVKKIVSGLRNFAHPDEHKVEKVDINQEVEKTLSLVWNELKYKCEVIREFQDVPEIECNAVQINQVLVNVLINASQAINKNGKITIKTYSRGNEVVVEISDTGKGMDMETIRKVFDPFFTTKEIGEGTGLGLSIAYGIIKNHGGNINVDSEPGKGTTFRISLPINIGNNIKRL